MATLNKLTPKQLTDELANLAGWKGEGSEISKTYAFEDYYEVMAFVNAVAFIAHAAEHHPDMEVGYNKVKVRYSTHDAGGVTELDVRCAEAVEDLI